MAFRGHRLALLGLLAPLGACAAGYTNALGYRARDAALRGDVDAFQALMSEAAETIPTFPRDNPKKTVLSHFLALGGSDRFLPTIEAWRAQGWVEEVMTCAIHRARYRGTAAADPLEAERAADVCLERAREAALAGDRRWEVEACLDEAPFLTLSATTALGRYLEMAAEPTEPYLFRAGLLGGMSKLYLQDPYARLSNAPTMDPAAAAAAAKEQLAAVRARFLAILGAVRARIEPGLLAGSTAFAALELERASAAVGTSFLGGFAESALPEDGDLAWEWVRALKGKDKIGRLVGLGLWDRRREPEGDAFWYVCAEEPRAAEGGRRKAAGRLFRAAQPAVDRAAFKRERCGALPRLFGPYPLVLTAKLASTASAALGRGDVDLALVLDPARPPAEASAP